MCLQCNIRKRLTILFWVISSIVSSSYALTAHEQLAQEAVSKYYSCLQDYAQSLDFELGQRVKELFEEGGNVVFNDLLEIGNGYVSQNQETDIDGYMSTIMGLWARNNQKLKIIGKIDPSSFIEENDPDYKEAGKKVVWVTATKSISVSGQPKSDIRETFKVKNGKIQVVSTPERSTAIINALRQYNRGDYEKAYYGFIQQINNNTADDDTYFYLGLMLKKGKNICKKMYPSSDLRDKLGVFYWMKSKRGHQALFHHRVYAYYHPDYKRINHPFQCGLMTVYKGDGDLYGYMNEKGKMVIPYKYRLAYSFSEKSRVAIVLSVRGKWGIINKRGDIVLDFLYNKIELNETTGFITVYKGEDITQIPLENLQSKIL